MAPDHGLWAVDRTYLGLGCLIFDADGSNEDEHWDDHQTMVSERHGGSAYEYAGC